MFNYDIVVIDYQLGNTQALYCFLKSIGGRVIISSDPDVIRQAKAIFLPGVGAFKTALKNLENLNLIPVLNEVRARDTFIIGICLGMQLFSDSSEEGGISSGLSWINGNVRSLKAIFNDHYMEPRSRASSENGLVSARHIGWNTLIQNVDFHSAFFSEVMADKPYFYFNHSYFLDCDPSNVVAYSTINSGGSRIKIPVIVAEKNILGLQFHPEKSQRAGQELVKNILRHNNIPIYD